MFDEYEKQERPKRNYWAYATIGLFVVILLVGITALVRSGLISGFSPSALFSSTREVSGEIFIVTKSRENIKMALVEVCAVPENQILEWIEAKQNKAQAERIKAKNKLDFQIQEKQKIENELKAAEAKEKRLSDSYTSNFGAGSFDAYMRASSYSSKLRIASIDRSMLVAKAELEYNYWFSSGYYLDGLTHCAVKAKTNSDGKFTIILPDNKKYAMVAVSSRKILKDDEFYHWLVWIAADTMSLTNDNLMEQNPPDGLIQEVKPLDKAPLV